MKTVFVLLILFHVASAAKHSMEYLFTSSSGLGGFPEFVGTLMVDGVQFSYWDSINKTVKTDERMTKFMRDNPNHQRWYSRECLKNQQDFRSFIVGIRQQLNQSEGVHVLQMRGGCEWDGETGETASFLTYGYDGENFMTLDTQQLTWRPLTPLARPIKPIWDTHTPRLEYIEHLYINDCPRRLKKYVPYVSEVTDRTVLISVTLLKKAYSYSVTCFATGFYPDNAVLFWRKDGEKLYEGVKYGEILPNNDDTFQMSVDLELPLDDWERYECVFQIDGVKQDIVTRLDELRSHLTEPQDGSYAPLIAIAIILKIVLCGFLIWRRMRRVMRPSSQTILLLPESA